MRKLLLGLILLAMPAVSSANPIDNKCPQFTPYGAPKSVISNSIYLCKTNYAINYRIDTKTPEYTVEHLTMASIIGAVDRTNDFRQDTVLPIMARSVLSDYSNSGYDRGHLAPAGDNTASFSIMSESFLLSNIIPQVPNNNRGIWDKLENITRVWAKANRDIYVISGTVYSSGYKTIGAGKVGVPTFIWKVIYDKTSNTAITFLFPNAALPTANLLKYKISIDVLESITKLDIMPLLNDTKLESAHGNNYEWPGIR